MNLERVVVSQGTADIASRSNEALGGTLDFATDDPANERRAKRHRVAIRRHDRLGESVPASVASASPVLWSDKEVVGAAGFEPATSAM